MNIFFSEHIMKNIRNRFKNFCHFHHDYKQQQHNVAGAGHFDDQSVFASGEADAIAIVIAIDAQQAR
jgi:hypothetical protein